MRVLLLTLLGVLSHAVAIAAPPRVAVIPGDGERAPTAATWAPVEAALSVAPDLALVERQEIRRLLGEQQLTAAGLAAPANAGRVGQLLAAELFLFVDKRTAPSVPAWRLQFVEARTGVVLHSLSDSVTNLISTPALVAKAARQAAAKATVPADQRHFLAFLGARSEEHGRALEPMADALAMVLAVDLNALPEVVLLDREHLDRLREEENLTGLDLALKTSAVLLEAGLRRASDTNRLAVTLVLRPLLNGDAVRLHLTASVQDFAALRTQVANGLREHFQVAAPVFVPASPREEATQFARRAQILFSFGQLDEAVRASEAAVALYPHPSICDVAVQCGMVLRGQWLNPRPAARIHNHRRARRGEPGYADYPTDLKVRILSSAVREFELEKLGRDFVAQHPREAAEPVNLFFGGTRRWGQEFLMDVHPDEPEATQLRQELFERMLARHWQRLDDCEAHWNEPLPDNRHGDHPQLKWLREMLQGLGFLKVWAPDEAQWARYIQLEINRALNPPAPLANRWGSSKASMWIHFPSHFQDYNWVPPEDRQFARQILKGLEPKTNALLHLMVHHALVYMNYLDRFTRNQSVADARTLLDHVLREMPVTHPVRQWNYDETIPEFPVTTALRQLPDPAEQVRYGLALFEPMLAEGDWRRLQNWGEAFTILVRAMDKAQRQDWTDRLLALVAEPEARQALIVNGPIEKFLLAEAPDRLPSRHSWDPYDVRPLLLVGQPPGEIVAATLQDANVVLLWFEETGNDVVRATVTRMTLPDGAWETVGQTSLISPKVPPRTSSSIRSVSDGHSFLVRSGGTPPHEVSLAVDPDAVYVATPRGGLAIFRPDRVKHFTHDAGLPAEEIHCLATARGKLFLGTKGLLEFDPASERFRTVASSRSLQERNPLEGGRDYTVAGLRPDEAGTGVWLYVNVIGGSQRWRYDLAGGSFDFDQHGPLPTAEVRLGDERFVGGDGLFISTNLNQPPKILSTLPDGRPLAPVRALVEADEQVVVALPREVWSVRRKSANAAAREYGAH